MSNLIFKLEKYFSLTLVILMLIISAILYFDDRKRFKVNQYKKEEKVAKVLSIIYLVGSISIYLVIKIIA